MMYMTFGATGIYVKIYDGRYKSYHPIYHIRTTICYFVGNHHD